MVTFWLISINEWVLFGVWLHVFPWNNPCPLMHITMPRFKNVYWNNVKNMNLWAKMVERDFQWRSLSNPCVYNSEVLMKEEGTSFCKFMYVALKFQWKDKRTSLSNFCVHNNEVSIMKETLVVQWGTCVHSILYFVGILCVCVTLKESEFVAAIEIFHYNKIVGKKGCLGHWNVASWNIKVVEAKEISCCVLMLVPYIWLTLKIA
jgi:hypothetical protein